MRIIFEYHGKVRRGILVGSVEGTPNPELGESPEDRPLNLVIQEDGLTHVKQFRASQIVSLALETSELALEEMVTEMANAHGMNWEIA